MAATNRPDIVDPAVLRPGRLDKILYVGLPELSDRVDILKALTKGGTKPELAEDVDFAEIAGLTEGYTGADLAGLVRQASLQTLKESIDGDSDSTDDLKVHKGHFVDAIKVLKPSVGEQVRDSLRFLRKFLEIFNFLHFQDIKHYVKLKEKYGSKKE
jgi:ribosome biogenesis ATPase